MFRNKYLDREIGRDYTFKSVILVGVYDVKTLKLKLRQSQESKYNSPWNIVIDFNVDMGFSEKEISTMLDEYSKISKIILEEKNTLFDSLIKKLENYEELYKYIEDILGKGRCIK
ncbi:hypothetical protein [Clostridium gasigenes]|nr:hypothetical protein [Clostridium gasigenes]MBB6622114.1 hypothetical protein [Clostridium gasigenes]